MINALTSQRVFVMCWAFAAICFGSLALGAYHFGENSPAAPEIFAGVRLPPSGPISHTASVGLNGQNVSLSVLPSSNGHMITADAQIESSQISTLQLEVVALRRRLAMLSEQNDNYSRRLAALESQTEPNSKDSPVKSEVVKSGPEPVPGTPVEAAAQRFQSSVSKPPMPQKRPALITATKTMSKVDTIPAPETGRGPLTSRPDQFVSGQHRTQHEPVRIVAVADRVSDTSDDAITTSSIDQSAVLVEEPQPTPMMIMPSMPAGKATGSGKSAIGRSDFGAVVGRYDTKELAAAAWLSFKEENSERMQDMLPVVAPSQLKPGKVDLLIGPFANAADAMVACLRLLDISETCHPALFVGDDASQLIAGLTPANSAKQFSN